jgi:hypothetical protein
MALVGVDENDPRFADAEVPAGENTHILNADELPPHDHGSRSLIGTFKSDGNAHSNQGILNSANGMFQIISGAESSGRLATSPGASVNNRTYRIDATHGHDPVGKGMPHNNVQRSFPLYAFKRVA